jgi:hypothetical protein
LVQRQGSDWAQVDLDQRVVLDLSLVVRGLEQVASGQAQADSDHSAGSARVQKAVGSDRSAGLKPQPKQKPERVAKIASRYQFTGDL